MKLIHLSDLHIGKRVNEVSMIEDQEYILLQILQIIDDFLFRLAKRNVLLTHQFDTGAATCESEEISVGGSDNVDASVFEAFDYVALGHIHGPQNIGSNRVRHCGTPLKYSFSECSHHKSVTVVNLGKKGELELQLRPLHLILSDEVDVPEAVGRLRQRCQDQSLIFAYLPEKGVSSPCSAPGKFLSNASVPGLMAGDSFRGSGLC